MSWNFFRDEEMSILQGIEDEVAKRISTFMKSINSGL